MTLLGNGGGKKIDQTKLFSLSAWPSSLDSITSSRVQTYGQTLLVQERSSGILLVAFYAPKTRNAFSDQMYQDLIRLFEYATNHDHIVAVVLTGHGPYFSSGANLKELPNPQAAQQEEDTKMTRNTL
jgi:enoyl-CoA hydratase/carnithine racemase